MEGTDLSSLLKLWCQVPLGQGPLLPLDDHDVGIALAMGIVALELGNGSSSVDVTGLGGSLREIVRQGSLPLKGTVSSKGQGCRTRGPTPCFILGVCKFPAIT